MTFDHIFYVVYVEVITCFFTTDGFKSQYALCRKQFLNSSELKKIKK
jgi:hypothetical protein